MRHARIVRKPITEHIAEQEQWIREHGGDKAGYVARYGSMNDEIHSGDGGELIYEADLGQLNALKAKAATRKYL